MAVGVVGDDIPAIAHHGPADEQAPSGDRGDSDNDYRTWVESQGADGYEHE